MNAKSKILDKLVSKDITSRIDKMDLYEQIQIITLEDARIAADTSYPVPKTLIHVKTYVTRSNGLYGFQFLSCVWIKINGEWFQASGSLTGGCGYDKISAAIGSAFNAIGIKNDISGTGTHNEFVLKLAKVLLQRKKFFMVR